MNFADWTPTNGETVHLNGRNNWHRPAGRYTLTERGGDVWLIVSPSTAQTTTTTRAMLHDACRAAILTPISADELEREKQMLDVRINAPLRASNGRRVQRQHDASSLALFQHADEPSLI